LKKFENARPVSFPVLSYYKLGYLSILNGIKVIRPYYFLDYSKQTAQEELIKLYNWEYYGGHHHENIFTKFIISYWMYEKFNIDKRKITLSAQIMNGDISRDEALRKINQLPYERDQINEQIEYVCKKLDLSREGFESLFNQPDKYYYHYPNSQKLIYHNLRFLKLISSMGLNYKPSSISQLELERVKKEQE